MCSSDLFDASAVYVTAKPLDDVASNGVPLALINRSANTGKVIACELFTIGVGVGVEVVFIVTPLLQTNFLPDLMQVNLFPW